MNQQQNPDINIPIEPTVASNTFLTFIQERKRVFFGIAVALVLVLGGVLFLISKKQPGKASPISNILRKKSQQSSENNQQETDTGSATFKTQGNSIVATIGSSYQVSIPTSWNVSVLNTHINQFFLSAKIGQNTIVDVETTKADKKPSAKFFVVDKTTQEKIGNNTVTIERGHETFGSSKRKFIVGTWASSQIATVFRIRVLSENESEMNTLFNKLSKTVTNPSGVQANEFKLVKEAFAQEQSIPSSLPQIQYKTIQVMDNPITENITKQDPVYQDGYVKGYKFVAFKSQKLDINAREVRELNGSSYMKLHLYSSDGKSLGGEGGTHREITAPYSGDYYLLTWTFDHQEGATEISVVDTNQLYCRRFFLNPDGSVNDYNKDNDSFWYLGETDVAFVLECPTPLEVSQDNVVSTTLPTLGGAKGGPYSATYKNAIVSSDLSYISGIMVDGKENREYVHFEDKEYKNTEKIPLSVSLMNSYRAIITPAKGLFAKNNIIEILDQYDKTYFYTLNKPGASVDILTSIVADYSDWFKKTEGVDDYQTYEPIRFEWINDGQTKTILGSVIMDRSNGSGTPRSEIFRKYFEEREFTQSSSNSFKDIPVNDQSYGATRDVVGMQKQNTICKLSGGSSERYMIMCGYLE